MTNRVAVFDPPRAISWELGRDIAGDGKPQFGGCTWRYDLVAAEPSRTAVTLTYDWTAAPPFLREHITFPPFPVDHVTNSLRHLAELVNRPQPMAFRYAVAERIGNRRAPLGQSMSSRV